MKNKKGKMKSSLGRERLIMVYQMAQLQIVLRRHNNVNTEYKSKQNELMRVKEWERSNVS